MGIMRVMVVASLDTPLIKSTPKRIFAPHSVQTQRCLRSDIDHVSVIIIAYLKVARKRGRPHCMHSVSLCKLFKSRPSQLLLCSLTTRRTGGDDKQREICKAELNLPYPSPVMAIKVYPCLPVTVTAQGHRHRYSR